MDVQHSTTNSPLFVALVEYAKKANEDQLFAALAALRNGNGKPAPAEPIRVDEKPRRPKVDEGSYDAFLSRYKEVFKEVSKWHDQKGHATIRGIIEEFDGRSVVPFKSCDYDQARRWLARHFARNHRRFEPDATPKNTTLDTVIWTVPAWQNQSKQAAAPSEPPIGA